MASRNNPYFTGVDQTLEEYIPMPMDMLLKAGQAVQGRYDKSVEDDSAMQTGLASIKTKALGHREYVNNMINSYKSESAALIDKYGGKLENPEFVREQRRVLNKYKNDPNWTTIEDNNKAVEQAQQIEAKMKAEGKLFISPLAEFTGKDKSGNLTAFTGSPELVNTLDEWESAYKIAHGSTQDIGNKTTNRVSLNNARQAMENDIKTGGVQSTKLMKAYMQSGMTSEQAKQAALSGVSSLVNKYGVDEKYNTGLMSLQLQRENMMYQRQRDQQEDALKRELAKKKADEKANPSTLTPSFDGFKERMGSVATLNIKVGDKTQERFVFGSGKSANGISSRDIANETVSGEIYDLSSGAARASNKSINIGQGKEVGTRNIWVREDNGELISMASKTATPKINYINGKAHISVKRGGKMVSVPVEERTVKEYTYNANAGHKGLKGEAPDYKSFFKVATPEEAVDQMGYSNASWKGMGQTKARGHYDYTKQKLDIDINFVEKNFNSEASKYYQSLEKKHNSGGTLTDQEKADITNLQNYDTRKALWDAKVLPKYENQGKAKHLLNQTIDE